MLKYNKENPLRVFEAFAGYGSQSIALKRLKEINPDFDFVNVGYSEIEPSAITAYSELHGNVKNFGNICLIDWSKVPDFDLFTYSWPCTDVSNAGRQAGFDKGSGTRSSLLWECERAVEIKRPKYLFMENVSALIQKKFISGFHRWLNILENYGYYNNWDVLNASDFGVPQNRKRVFCISILRTEEEPEPRFYFPSTRPLELRLADILQEEVEDKYFLSDKMLARFCEKSLEEEGKTIEPSSDENDEEYFEDEDDFENFFVAQ